VAARDYAKGKATTTISRWPIRGPRDERKMTMNHRTGTPVWWTAIPRARACPTGLDASRASHHRVDVGVVPHVEDAGGAAAPARTATGPGSGSRWPGAMTSPTTEVNTASNITRGFIS